MPARPLVGDAEVRVLRHPAEGFSSEPRPGKGRLVGTPYGTPTHTCATPADSGPSPSNARPSRPSTSTGSRPRLCPSRRPAAGAHASAPDRASPLPQQRGQVWLSASAGGFLPARSPRFSHRERTARLPRTAASCRPVRFGCGCPAGLAATRNRPGSMSHRRLRCRCRPFCSDLRDVASSGTASTTLPSVEDVPRRPSAPPRALPQPTPSLSDTGDLPQPSCASAAWSFPGADELRARSTETRKTYGRHAAHGVMNRSGGFPGHVVRRR